MTHPDRAIEAGARVLCSEMTDSWAHGKKYWRCVMQSVITALAAEGLVVVPKEPTVAMIDAARNNGFEGNDDHVRSDWSAMLAASQEQNDASDR